MWIQELAFPERKLSILISSHPELTAFNDMHSLLLIYIPLLVNFCATTLCVYNCPNKSNFPKHSEILNRWSMADEEEDISLLLSLDLQRNLKKMASKADRKHQ